MISFGREGQDILLNLMKWCFQRHFFFYYITFLDLSTAFLVKKFSFFSQVFLWDSIPRPGKRATLDPSSRKEVVFVKFFFRRLLESSMDQHAVKGQASLLFSTTLYFAFLSMLLRFQRRKRRILNEQHILSLKIIAFFSCSYISHVPKDY